MEITWCCFCIVSGEKQNTKIIIIKIMVLGSIVCIHMHFIGSTWKKPLI